MSYGKDRLKRWEGLVLWLKNSPEDGFLNSQAKIGRFKYWCPRIGTSQLQILFAKDNEFLTSMVYKMEIKRNNGRQ